MSPAPTTPTRSVSPTGGPRPRRRHRQARRRDLAVQAGAEQAEEDEGLGAGAAHVVPAHPGVVGDHQLVEVVVAATHLVSGERAFPGPDEDRVDARLDQRRARAGLARQPLAAELRRAVEHPRLLDTLTGGQVGRLWAEVMVLVEVRVAVLVPVHELEREPLALGRTVLGPHVLEQQVLADDAA